MEITQQEYNELLRILVKNSAPQRRKSDDKLAT